MTVDHEFSLDKSAHFQICNVTFCFKTDWKFWTHCLLSLHFGGKLKAASQILNISYAWHTHKKKNPFGKVREIPTRYLSDNSRVSFRKRSILTILLLIRHSSECPQHFSFLLSSSFLASLPGAQKKSEVISLLWTPHGRLLKVLL